MEILWEGLGYGAAYSVVGLVMLLLGYYVLDALTPGHLGRHLVHEHSMSAAVVAAAWFLGIGLILFTAIWTNGESGFGQALLNTVCFGLLGIVIQAAAFVALDLLTPDKLGHIVCQERVVPMAVVSAAGLLAVSGVICASIA